MAIAVAEHEVAPADHAVPDDLVRRRRAADDEQRFVGAEDARGVALALGDRPGVIEQRAELADRDRDVGAQRVLAEELDRTAGRPGSCGSATPPPWPGVCQE